SMCRIVARVLYLARVTALGVTTMCARIKAKPEALKRFLEKRKDGHHQSQGRHPTGSRNLVCDLSLGSYREGIQFVTGGDSLRLAPAQPAGAVFGESVQHL